MTEYTVYTMRRVHGGEVSGTTILKHRIETEKLTETWTGVALQKMFDGNCDAVVILPSSQDFRGIRWSRET